MLRVMTPVFQPAKSKLNLAVGAVETDKVKVEVVDAEVDENEAPLLAMAKIYPF